MVEGFLPSSKTRKFHIFLHKIYVRKLWSSSGMCSGKDGGTLSEFIFVHITSRVAFCGTVVESQLKVKPLFLNLFTCVGRHAFCNVYYVQIAWPDYNKMIDGLIFNIVYNRLYFL